MTKTVKLGEICEKIISGGTPSTEKPEFWGGEIPWITSADIKDHYTVIARKFLSPKAGATILPAGNVLVVTRVGLGKLVVNKVPLAFSQDLQGLVLKKNVNPNFLVYALSQKVLRFKEISRGATIKGVTREDLANISIPLPPLDEQRRIAALLDRADALRHKDRKLLDHYNALAQSVFLDMFGDPVRNEKGWEMKMLGEISSLQGGLQITPLRKAYPIQVPYLRVANVYKDLLWLDEIKEIRVTKDELERTCLKKGDVLIVEGHGNPNEVGRASVWDGSIEPCTHQNHLIRIRLFSNIVSPIFVSFYHNSIGGRDQLAKMGKTTSGLNTISASNVKSLKLPVPPLPLQTKFAAIIETIEAQKAVVRQQMAQSEALFGRLLQDAFGG